MWGKSLEIPKLHENTWPPPPGMAPGVGSESGLDGQAAECLLPAEPWEKNGIVTQHRANGVGFSRMFADG